MSNETGLSYWEKIMYFSFYFQIHKERNMNFPNSVPNSMPNSRQIVLILANSDLELRSRSRAKSTLLCRYYHSTGNPDPPLMAYSHWLNPGPKLGQGSGPAQTETIGSWSLCNVKRSALYHTTHFFPVPVPVSGDRQCEQIILYLRVCHKTFKSWTRHWSLTFVYISLTKRLNPGHATDR